MTRPAHPRVRPDPHQRHDEPSPSDLDRSGGGLDGPEVDLDDALTVQIGSAERPAVGLPASGVLTLAQLAALPASVSLLEAARALGIGRTSAYQLARDGQFPCPLIKVGVLYRVPTAGLLRLLGLASPTHPDRAAGPGEG